MDQENKNIIEENSNPEVIPKIISEFEEKPKMNKKYLIFLNIFILAILAIGIFYILKPSEPNPEFSQVGKCGDGICGKVEKANPDLCPQDCEKIDNNENIDNNDISDYKDSPFGFHYATKLGDSVSDLGVRWVRVNAVWGILQSEGEIKNEIYNWDKLEDEKWIIDSYPEDINLLITFSNLGTPVGESNSYIPNDGVYTEESWIKFTKAVVNKYKDRVKYFQVENEPKINLKDYAKLQKITYNAVKEECNECQVVMGGVFWGGGSIDQWDRSNQRILQELNGKYIDIFDQHYYGDASDYNPKTLLDHAKKRLAEANFNEIPIWITEMGGYSGDPKGKGKIDPPYQTEQVQAQGLFKRYISSLSYDVKKIFWAWGLYEGYQHDEGSFDFTGLIYDGEYAHDLGYGVKKLAYYTYKIMTEKLEGSDWNNIEIVQELNDVYVYKFTKNGKSIWVAWNDNSSSQKISLNVGNLDSVKITEAVPKYESGKEVTNYSTAFNEETKTVNNGKIIITLGEVPVFVEEN